MIFKIFSPKNLAFLLKLLFFEKKSIITLVFWGEIANFFAKIGKKSQKLVIITSTPDWDIFGDGLVSVHSFLKIA
jgi:hypothetical protein